MAGINTQRSQRLNFCCVLVSVVLVLSWLGGGIEIIVSIGGDPNAPSASLKGHVPAVRGAAATADTPNTGPGSSADVEHVIGGEPMSFEPTESYRDWTRPPGVADTATGESLEFVKDSEPLVLWQRKGDSEASKAVREAIASAPAGGGPRRARLACMYAGFMRNWEWMMGQCHEMQTRKFCAFPRCRKLFGNQRKHLLDSTGCDAYISTWHIRGVGRWSTFDYDVTDELPVDRVMRLYDKWLFALHVQNYSLYGPVWDSMHRYARQFPQTYPTHAESSDDPLRAKWSGRAETKKYLRRNDFSQAYKHWCVLQLVLRSGIEYDAYFRLRTDLRMNRLMSPPMVHPSGDVKFELVYTNGSKSRHVANAHRVHVNNFDVGDFGFFGIPSVIKALSERIWLYCLADPEPGGPLEVVRHVYVSEYNLMLWRVIFDERWEVDSGYRYLWVSRSTKKCKKKKAERAAAKAKEAADAAARSSGGAAEDDDD